MYLFSIDVINMIANRYPTTLMNIETIANLYDADLKVLEVKLHAIRNEYRQLHSKKRTNSEDKKRIKFLTERWAKFRSMLNDLSNELSIIDNIVNRRHNYLKRDWEDGGKQRIVNWHTPT